MRRRAGMCWGRTRDIEACGCRFVGRDEVVVAAAVRGCVVVVVVVVVGGSGGGGGGGGATTEDATDRGGVVAVGGLSFFEADGGGAYVGCLGRKKFRIEDCPLAWEGSDMVVVSSSADRNRVFEKFDSAKG